MAEGVLWGWKFHSVRAYEVQCSLRDVPLPLDGGFCDRVAKFGRYFDGGEGFDAVKWTPTLN